jgi:hypothetical protein
MTVLRSTGAPPLTDTMWNLLDWDHAVEVVTRLQTRIAKATQDYVVLPGPHGGRWKA